MREVARRTETAAGAVQRELKALERVGILRRRARGNQVLYRANRESPIFPELQSLVLKTSGLVDVLRDALQPLRDRISLAFVFGSLAAGRATGESDVDLFVVGAVDFGEIVNALQGVNATLGREVNPVVAAVREYEKRVREGDHFVTALRKEPKLFVLGDPDDIDRLAAARVADAAPDQSAGDRGAPGDHRA